MKFSNRNQSEVMETLIKKGAVVDCSNRGRCTPLHVAVNKQFPACVNILLKYGCDVNIQASSDFDLISLSIDSAVYLFLIYLWKWLLFLNRIVCVNRILTVIRLFTMPSEKKMFKLWRP